MVNHQSYIMNFEFNKRKIRNSIHLVTKIVFFIDQLVKLNHLKLKESLEIKYLKFMIEELNNRTKQIDEHQLMNISIKQIWPNNNHNNNRFIFMFHVFIHIILQLID